MRTKKSSLLPVILFFLSCSSGNLIIDEPVTFRQFQIRKSLLEDKVFILENVCLYRFSTNIQVSANDVNCYILLISEKPEKYIVKDEEKQFQESIFPPDNIIACYIPASDVKLIESLLNLKNGDRIKKINGTGKYPMMMENTKSNACFSVKIVDFKIPYTTIGIFVNSLEL